MKSDLITMVKNLTVDKVALQHENNRLKERIKELEYSYNTLSEVLRDMVLSKIDETDNR